MGASQFTEVPPSQRKFETRFESPNRIQTTLNTASQTTHTRSQAQRLTVSHALLRKDGKFFRIPHSSQYAASLNTAKKLKTHDTLEIDGSVASKEVPDGIVKWDGEYRSRASGKRYSEEEILHAQREGFVLLKMTVFQGQHGYYREEVWFSKGRDEEEYWSSEDEGYICRPGWKSPEEYLEETEESYPDEVKEKAVEIMEKAVWLPNFSHPTGRGKYFLEGKKSGESGFISGKKEKRYAMYLTKREHITNQW